MAVLNIALLGACPLQVSELAVALDRAECTGGRPIMLVTAGGPVALPANLIGFDLVLLAGLEVAVPARVRDVADAAPDQDAIDQSIRAALAGISYRVLYGTVGERLAHALHAVDSLLSAASRPRHTTRPDGLKHQPWAWMCEKCSDPQCEHRLLTALLAGRESPTTVSVVNAWGKQVRPY